MFRENHDFSFSQLLTYLDQPKIAITENPLYS